MPRIAISYRRQDSAGTTGRISEKLASHFGDESVFIDIDSIAPGIDFREHIRNVISRSDVVLAVIGGRWTDRANRKRLSDPEDLVRVEIQTALENRIPLIPVLVDYAPMPSREHLPDPLKAIATLNAAQVEPGRDFKTHMDRLIRSIERHIDDRAVRASAEALAADIASTVGETIANRRAPEKAQSVADPEPAPVIEPEPAPIIELKPEVQPEPEQGTHDVERLGLSAVSLALSAPGQPSNLLDTDEQVLPLPKPLADGDRSSEAGQVGKQDAPAVAAEVPTVAATKAAASDPATLEAALASLIGRHAVVGANRPRRRRYGWLAIAPAVLGLAGLSLVAFVVYQALNAPALPNIQPSQTIVELTPPKVVRAPESKEQNGSPFVPPSKAPAMAPAAPAAPSTSEPTKVKTVPVRPDPAPGTAAAVPAAGAYAVQVSSQRTEAEAQSSYRAMQQRYPSVLGNREPNIRRVDLGSGGIFYRAQVGPFATMEQATAFCNDLKNAGGQCIVQRN